MIALTRRNVSTSATSLGRSATKVITGAICRGGATVSS